MEADGECSVNYGTSVRSPLTSHSVLTPIIQRCKICTVSSEVISNGNALQVCVSLANFQKYFCKLSSVGFTRSRLRRRFVWE